MSNKQEETELSKAEDIIGWIIVIGFFIAMYFVISWVFSFVGGLMVDQTPTYERAEIKEKMEEHLYGKYGEEFVVNRIGQRKFGDTVFYQGQIYPKRFRGTNKQGDEYYQAEVNIDILDSGELRDPGDTYGRVIARKRAEEYLMRKVQEIFGARVKLKPGIRHLRTNPNGYFVGYLTPDFEDALDRSINDPENNKLKFDLDVYVFNRIENDEEKEERREDIFEFVQYLQEERLFEYLEMRVFFVDERVLAPSYDEFERKVRNSNKVTKEVEGQDGRTVELPPMDLRERMSRELQKEIDEMNEEELLANMQEIRKDELTYEGIRKNNTQYRALVYSKGMMKERYTSSYRSGSDNVRDYDDITDVILDRSLVYKYVN